MTDSKPEQAIIATTVHALALPDEQTFRSGLEAIRRFQAIAQSQMIQGHDYGVIPGTQKPTLLKPGAEKIIRLLGLADEYIISEQMIDWQKPFFHYVIRCILRHLATGTVVCEGLGECNSMEVKYRWRWAWPSELPLELQGDAGKATRERLVSRLVNTRNGKARQYRLANDEVWSVANTILKMAKKRAMVDAALSAGRLSDVFTQDLEDIRPEPPPDAPEQPGTQAQAPAAIASSALPQTPVATTTEPVAGPSTSALPDATFSAINEACHASGQAWSGVDEWVRKTHDGRGVRELSLEDAEKLLALLQRQKQRPKRAQTPAQQGLDKEEF